MNILEFKSQVGLLFKHQITPFIWGAHGIGKTSIVSQYCAERGYKYVMQALGTKEAGDIQGLLDTKDGTSAFLPPTFVAEVNNWANANPDSFAVIHFDEVNHIMKEMQAVLFAALLGNQVGDVKMATNVRYVASGNPPTKDYPGVFDFRNLALVDRFCHIDLVPTASEWAMYAKTAGVDDIYVDFFLASPQFLDPPSEAYDVFKKVKGSRRSAVTFARLAADGADMELLTGIVGPAAVASYMAYVKNRDEDTVLKGDIIGRKALTKKTKAALERWSKDEQYGKIEALLSQLTAHFSGMEVDTATQQDADRVHDLMTLIPVDIAYAYMLNLTENIQSINMKFDKPVNPKAQAYWENVIKEGKVKINVK